MEGRRIKRFLIVGLILIFNRSNYALTKSRDNNIFHSSNFSSRLISINVVPRRVSYGDTVQITIKTKEDTPVNASLLVPDRGLTGLKLTCTKPSIYTSQIVIGDQYPQGIYAVQAWQGNRNNPETVGKGTFLYGKIIADFCSVGIFESEHPGIDMTKYLTEMKRFGANFLIATGIMTSKRVYYNSKICNTDNSSPVDRAYLGTLLKCADENGYSVMLPATWDMTRNIPYPKRESSIKQITRELYEAYLNHPSFVGFYVEQEGSGIYYAPFIRELCDYVKGINPGLLTACAPYVDNPLLAGYLSVISNLDIIIYQGMVMASYRPDNRLKFPFRRVKDFCSLATGSKQLQNKIALTHVETFGYGETSLRNLFITGYDNIYQQILSAGTVADNDGIIMFDYSSIIYNTLRDNPQYKDVLAKSRDAVFDGMKAFQLIGMASKKLNQIAVYLPYTDWQEYRWKCYYYSALDAFRIMGIPVDILPYAPPEDESYPPYWPYHENADVLKRLLKLKEVLVLPNITGFQATDSDLIQHFVKDGGIIVAFGPEIPMGRTYDRGILFGIEKTKKIALHTEVMSKTRLKDGSAQKRVWEIGKIKVPVWRSKSAEVIARFEDGSPAITLNRYGKGEVVSVLIDAKTSALKFSSLVRGIFDIAGVHRSVDIVGTNENCDVAVSKTKNGFVAAVVNHNDKKIEVTLRPLTTFRPRESEKWIDIASGKKIAHLKKNEPLDIEIKPRSFRVIEMVCEDIK